MMLVLPALRAATFSQKEYEYVKFGFMSHFWVPTSCPKYLAEPFLSAKRASGGLSSTSFLTKVPEFEKKAYFSSFGAATRTWLTTGIVVMFTCEARDAVVYTCREEVLEDSGTGGRNLVHVGILCLSCLWVVLSVSVERPVQTALQEEAHERKPRIEASNKRMTLGCSA